MVQKKNYYLLVSFFLLTFNLYGQQTGIFQKTILHNSQTRTLEYAVPVNYNSATQYPLIIGLQGCVDPNGSSNNGAIAFRNELAFLADSIQAIIVCPTGLLSNQGGFMDNPDNAIILAAIDSTVDTYNTDTTEVYLTGFSCNGYTTVKYGTRGLYPWKGIIPIHAFLPSNVFSPAAYRNFDYQTTIPTCICVGSQDPGLGGNQTLRDSFVLNGTPFYYNEILGVGHTTQFPTFKEEIMECFNYFNTLALSAKSMNELETSFIHVYPNPPLDRLLTIEVFDDAPKDFLLYNSSGQKIKQSILREEINTIDLSEVKEGIYFWMILQNSKPLSRGKVVLH